MASYVAVAVVLLFLTSAAAADQDHHGQSSTPRRIQQACKATRFPELCGTSLENSGLVPPDPSPFQIVRSALALSSKHLETTELMVRAILQYSAGNTNRSTAAGNCLEALGNAEYRLNSTAEVLSRGRMKDARAWTSAALSYYYDCWSGLKRVNDEQMVNNTVSFFNETLMTSTSNVLSMMMAYDEYGNRTGSWVKPRTERDGFWESVGGGSDSVREPGIPLGLKADVTVCKGGGCTHATVQAAVDAAPENLSGRRRFVIKIKEGVYAETVRVPLRKKNLVFLGDGMGKTVITGSLHVGHGLSTYNTATVGVLGDGFMARDLTIQNTAGPETHQAVAFRSDSDLSVVENCELIGHQDTLYVHSLRQLYKSCIIQGNVDFIFGNSASVFQDCTILVRPRQHAPEHGENNAVTAHGRTDPAQMTGLVFRNCLVNGTEEYMRLYHNKPSVHKTYLGRPWKEYSRVVFVNCQLEELVSAPGWMAWEGDFALKTLYFGEFGNSGLGSNVSGRVHWSSQIPSNHVDAYSVQNFIQSEEWNMLTYSNHVEISL